MKKQTPLNVLLSILLAAATLLGPANSESPCAGIHEVGSDFSVTSWNCVNYIAEFSWNLDLTVADTTLQLTCHNDTQEYSPDVLRTFRTSESHTHTLPLSGSVVCAVSGCYEDRDRFESFLIQPSHFTCHPPPSPSPSYVAISSSLHLSPSPSLSPSQHSPIETTPSTTDTQAPLPSSPSPPDMKMKSRGLEVVIIAVPVSSVMAAVLVVFLLLICWFELHRRFCISDSGKYMVNMPIREDELDPDFSLTLTDYRLCGSTNTILELPDWKPTATPTQDQPPTPTSDTTDSVSISSSQQPFLSLQSEHLVTDTPSHTPQDERHHTADISNAISCYKDQVKCDTTNASNATSHCSSSYVCESDVRSSSGAPLTHCSTGHISHLTTTRERFSSKTSSETSDQFCSRMEVAANERVGHEETIERAIGSSGREREGGIGSSGREREGGVNGSSGREREGGVIGSSGRERGGGIGSSGKERGGVNVSSGRERGGGIGSSGRERGGAIGSSGREREGGGIGSSGREREGGGIGSSGRERGGGIGSSGREREGGGIGSSGRERGGGIGSSGREREGGAIGSSGREREGGAIGSSGREREEGAMASSTRDTEERAIDSSDREINSHLPQSTSTAGDQVGEMRPAPQSTTTNYDAEYGEGAISRPVTQETGKIAAAPQSVLVDEVSGQCDDEVVQSIVERLTHTGTTHNTHSHTTSGTSSGLSTSSYLQWSTTEH